MQGATNETSHSARTNTATPLCAVFLCQRRHYEGADDVEWKDTGLLPLRAANNQAANSSAADRHAARIQSHGCNARREVERLRKEGGDDYRWTGRLEPGRLGIASGWSRLSARPRRGAQVQVPDQSAPRISLRSLRGRLVCSAHVSDGIAVLRRDRHSRGCTRAGRYEFDRSGETKDPDFEPGLRQRSIFSD